MHTENKSENNARFFAGWARPVLVGGVALAALVGVGLAGAIGQGMGGRMGAEFAQYRLERMLERVEATPDQTQKVKTIFEAARDDILPLTEGFRSARQEAVQILTAPAIDRAAAETLRAGRVAAMDAVSKRLTTAVLDVAEVLTPEQRAEVADEIRANHMDRQ